MRRALPLLWLITVALLIAGCSDSSSDTRDATSAAPMAVEAAAKADFPQAEGKSLSELREGLQGGIVLAPSVSVLDPGKNRYGFALFDAARKQITGAQVAVYVSKNDGTAVRGPFVARSESLAVRPQYQAVSTKADPDAGTSVYVAQVSFPPGSGKYRVSAIADLDGRLISTSSFGANVTAGGDGEPPRVGDRAPKVHTPTLDEVAGDAERISTRNPPAKDLLKTDLADVLGKKPVLLVFATPALCASRVCGPVVDILEQTRARYGKDDVAFIHNEIYRENRVDQGLRPEPARFRLPTEPWLFVIGRDGRVVQRIEGAFSADEAEKALETARASR